MTTHVVVPLFESARVAATCLRTAINVVGFKEASVEIDAYINTLYASIVARVKTSEPLIVDYLRSPDHITWAHKEGYRSIFKQAAFLYHIATQSTVIVEGIQDDCNNKDMDSATLVSFTDIRNDVSTYIKYYYNDIKTNLLRDLEGENNHDLDWLYFEFLLRANPSCYIDEIKASNIVAARDDS